MKKTRCFIASRVGKVARCPFWVREALKERLIKREPASIILAWLNSIPEVQEMLRQSFGGTAIRAQNLSTWRRGGFLDSFFAKGEAEKGLMLMAEAKTETFYLDHFARAKGKFSSSALFHCLESEWGIIIPTAAPGAALEYKFYAYLAGACIECEEIGDAVPETWTLRYIADRWNGFKLGVCNGRQMALKLTPETLKQSLEEWKECHSLEGFTIRFQDAVRPKQQAK